MIGTVWGLALAAAFLLGTHFGISSSRLRPALVDRIGEGAYLGLYSLVSLVAFGWFVAAYAAVPFVPLWDWAPSASRRRTAGRAAARPGAPTPARAPNPTLVGMDKALTAAEPARGLLRITRHPLMWGVGLWGLAHMVPNGDLGSLLFFGTLAALSLVGAVLIDAKKRAARGLDWERFEEATSLVPFAAVLDGRQSLARAAAEFGTWRLLLTVVLYGALLHLHPWLFGVNAIPR